MAGSKVYRGRSAILSSSAAGLLSIATGILILPLIIATVGSGPYGVWLVIVAVASYLQLMDLGIGAALVHFTSRARGGEKFEASTRQMLGAALLWNIAAGSIAVIGISVASSMYVASDEVRGLLAPNEGRTLVMLGAITLGSITLKPFSSVLVGQGRLPLERLQMVIGLIFRIVGSLLGCLVFDSLLIVALAEMAGIVLPPMLSMVTVFRMGLLPQWNRATLQTLRFMWSFSLRSFATSAVSLLILQSGTIIVAIVATPSSATYFTAAFRIFTGVRQVIAWTTDPFRSMLARVFVTDAARAREMVLTLGFLALFIASAGSVIIMLVANDFVRLWLGSDVPVETIALTISILLAGVVLNALHMQFPPAAEAFGRPGAFFWMQVFWLALLVPTALALGSLGGVVGVAVGIMLPLVLIEPLYIASARRVIDFEIGTWWSATVAPTALVLAIPLLVALLIAVVWPGSTLIAATVFGLGATALAILLRQRRPFADVLSLLRAEL